MQSRDIHICMYMYAAEVSVPLLCMPASYIDCMIDIGVAYVCAKAIIEPRKGLHIAYL